MKSPAFLFVLFLFPAILQAQTLPPAFVTCPSTGFQVINNPTNFQTVNLATGTTTTVATFAIYVNAIGYNPNDNRIYGIKQGSPYGLIAIGSDYSYQQVTTSGAALQSSVVGDINPAGILWCLGSSNVYTINCNPSAGANFGKVTLLGAKPAVSITDWSFPSNDNTKIYSVTNTGNLIYINTSDLSVQTVMTSAVPAESYGATYFDGSGNFYAKGNTSGTIYKFVNATTPSPTVITFSTSSASGQNDGARCPDAPAAVIADYGDAPDTYTTYTSSGGPVHLLPSPNPALAKIFLGAAVTIDEDGNPGVAANADSDDGISSFAPINGGAVTSSIPSYSVTVSVNNTSATVANLAGWIDWNNNGQFDAGERVAATVAANFTGSKTLTWNSITLSGPVGTTGTYARFRISTDALSSPGGMAANGEVEDYYIPFGSVLPISISSFTAVASNTSSHLSWITASEQNNKGFTIERSATGTVFNEIGFVPSPAINGTLNEKISYNYYDVKPFAGINYYRIKLTGDDGKVTYSPTVKVVFKNTAGVIIVYPNPAKDKISIDGLKGNESIQLYNITGRLLKNEKAGGSIYNLDINKIAVGIYRLTITDAEGNTITKKIVKQ